MIAKVKEKCDICGEEIGASSPIALKRVIGFHKRVHHGIPGATGTPAGKRSLARARHWRLQGLNPEQIAAREREFLSRHPESGNNGLGNEIPLRKYKPKPKDEAVPMALDKCPFCGSRFWGCKGDKVAE